MIFKSTVISLAHWNGWTDKFSASARWQVVVPVSLSHSSPRRLRYTSFSIDATGSRMRSHTIRGSGPRIDLLRVV